MEEVSVGAAGSTSVVDLSGDSHLQVIFNPKETFSQHDPSRLIFRTPCQRRTKWSSQSTQEQVDKFPDRDQHYLSETYIISKGMPEFAKSEFSVIRLHEVNVTTHGTFLFTPALKKKYTGCHVVTILQTGLHLAPWCHSREPSICRVHHPSKGIASTSCMKTLTKPFIQPPHPDFDASREKLQVKNYLFQRT